MNYDRVILELIDKMGQLEERVTLLEQKDITTKGVASMDIQENIRTFTKDDVIGVIKEQLSKYNITVRKASNSEGGGIFLTYPNGLEKHVMLKLSRDYVPTNSKKFAQFKWRSWHRIVHEDTPSFDDYIFSIEHDEKVDFFIMNQDSYMNLTKEKVTDKNSNYYFYFVEDQLGNVYEDRDDLNDMKPYYNNWDNFKLA